MRFRSNREEDMLVPLSGNRDRLERILTRTDLTIAWSRLVRKAGEWYLQLTIRLPLPRALPYAAERILGVSFGTDAIATWTLLDRGGVVLEKDSMVPNEQLLAFFKEKRQLEWDQKKRRWLGGRRFARQLEAITHKTVNAILALAKERGAALAVEDIAYAAKRGPQAEENLLFTAWNYGQLRRFLGYKAAVLGLGQPRYISNYLVTFTCPSCGARRGRGETKERAVTWREKDVLHCRRCGFSGALSGAEKSERVAREAAALLSRRAAESQ
jgi:transposase